MNADNATLKFKVKRWDQDVEFPIALEVRLDGETRHKITPGVDDVEIELTFDDNEATHVLELEMSEKTYAHTKIGKAGQIVGDTGLEIYGFELEDIDINFAVEQNSTYTHAYNNPDPDAEQTVSKVNGMIGCNGIVRFEFTTPAFIWLLENI